MIRRFKSIYDGKSQAGWAGPSTKYEIADGAIRCKPEQAVRFITTRNSPTSSPRGVPSAGGGNNGLAIRYPGKGDTAYLGMCELQVLDNTAPKYANLDKRQYHGSVYGMVAARAAGTCGQSASGIFRK